MIDAGRIRFVYFDLDDTLLDHKRAERLALRELHSTEDAFSTVPFDDFVAAYRVANASVWPRFAAAEISKEQTKALRFSLTLEGIGHALPVAGTDHADSIRLGDRYLELYGKHWHFIDGADVALRSVAARYPVGLLTNGFSEIQRKKLVRFPELESLCGQIIISDEFGAMKPYPKIFEVAARSAGQAPETLLYVGDSWRSDVEGALGAGWQVAWYSEQRVDGGPFTFSNWDTLLKALGCSN